MNTLRNSVALSLLLAVAGMGAAQAQGVAAGDYKLAVGHAAPCSVTLVADGSVTVGTDCTRVSDVSHWRPTSSGLQFQDNSGTTVAVLKAKGDGYEGQTFADDHQLVLTH